MSSEGRFFALLYCPEHLIPTLTPLYLLANIDNNQGYSLPPSYSMEGTGFPWFCFSKMSVILHIALAQIDTGSLIPEQSLSKGQEKQGYYHD